MIPRVHGTFVTSAGAKQSPLPGRNSSSHGRRGKYKANNVYSTALTVTIAVGCSLLIVNIIIFIGIYYQRDRSKRAEKDRPVPGSACANAAGVYGSTVQLPPNTTGDTYELTDKSTLYPGGPGGGRPLPPSNVYVGSMRAPPPSPAANATNNQLQNTLRRKQQQQQQQQRQHFYPGDLLPPPPPVIIMEPSRK